MKQIAKIKRSLIKRIFALCSFTTALFVFQACYGMPHDLEYMVEIEGKVKSKSTDLPIPGIRVFIENAGILGETDQDGQFYTLGTINNETLSVEPISFSFRDIDSTENGSFKDLDTLFIPPYGEDPVHFNVRLSEEN